MVAIKVEKKIKALTTEGTEREKANARRRVLIAPLRAPRFLRGSGSSSFRQTVITSEQIF